MRSAISAVEARLHTALNTRQLEDPNPNRYSILRFSTGTLLQTYWVKKRLGRCANSHRKLQELVLVTRYNFPLTFAVRGKIDLDIFFISGARWHRTT